MVNEEYKNFVASRFRPVEDTALTNHECAIQHALTGIVTELGELGDIIKRAHFYNQPLDVDHFSEEAGDLLFYVFALCWLMERRGGPSVDDILAQNRLKLEKRYPSGFSPQAAADRADKIT